ncbi:hypothetical protein PENTCL1PPCAC_19151, partial [Pristionchus entomophagus]
GPIRRLNDQKFCPSTPGGYINHLEKTHKSTLIANGIYLTFNCGLEVRASHDRSHIGECDRRQFFLHKLNEK